MLMRQDAFLILPMLDGVEGISSAIVGERMQAGESVTELLCPEVLGVFQNMENKAIREIDRFRGRYGFLSNFYQTPISGF